MMRGLRIGNMGIEKIVLAVALVSGAGLDKPSGENRLLLPSQSGCQVQPTVFEGWKAQQITNEWLQLVIVPQIGGRLMQVTFAGHPYLFVNPKYSGKYFPPSQSDWFNYGGDKIWPMPEGSQDDQHWPGPVSDALDDGQYAFSILSQGKRCRVRLEGPPDSRTGLHYTREISVDDDAPEISFHATMTNSSSRAIRWSMQTVTQYDTSDTRSSEDHHRDFWAFTPANPQSSYPDGYRVRSGLADDPSYSVKNGLFTLRWLYLQSEVWIDSPGDWLAVVDGTSRLAMIERFKFHEDGEYPGRATVIFYKNGPAVEVSKQGSPVIRTSEEDALFYMEAELNSPIVRLAPKESYSFDTDWFPTRIGTDLRSVTTAGVVSDPLFASFTPEGLKLSGIFGLFYSGRLTAHLMGGNGQELALVSLQDVSPLESVILNRTIKAPSGTKSVSIHLTDRNGIDRGALAYTPVANGAGGS